MKMDVIELWPTIVECALCGAETKIEYSVPMYEGKIVDDTKTDDWAGFPVCKECFENEGRGGIQYG